MSIDPLWLQKKSKFPNRYCVIFHYLVHSHHHITQSGVGLHVFKIDSLPVDWYDGVQKQLSSVLHFKTDVEIRILPINDCVFSNIKDPYGYHYVHIE